VADDNATNRRILAEFLAAWGVLADEARDGAEAIDALAAAARAGRPYSVVVTDCKMPRADGFAVAEFALANPAAAASVVLLTSAGARGPRARARELGVAATLVKPVGRNDLYGVLVGAVNPARGAARDRPPPEVEAPPPARRLRVLVAEDQPVNQMLVRRMLE